MCKHSLLPLPNSLIKWHKFAQSNDSDICSSDGPQGQIATFLFFSPGGNTLTKNIFEAICNTFAYSTSAFV